MATPPHDLSLAADMLLWITLLYPPSSCHVQLAFESPGTSWLECTHCLLVSFTVSTFAPPSGLRLACFLLPPPVHVLAVLELCPIRYRLDVVLAEPVATDEVVW